MVTTVMRNRWAVLGLFVAAVLVVAVVGSLSALDSGAEYLALKRPAWAPPRWLFGPAWTLLYALIALSGWLAWLARGWTPAFGWYAAQLVLNLLWTPLFFAAGQYGLAFAEIVLLWLAIVANITVFWRIRRAAALLLVPYLLWVTYAGALNFAIWQLN